MLSRKIPLGCILALSEVHMSDTYITLPEHEMHSEARAEQVEAHVKEAAEHVIEAVHQQCAPSASHAPSATHHEALIMSEHGMSDKVEVKNIFEPGRGGSGDGGLNAMAAIAALGNRNEQGAASFLPAMAMMGNRGHDGWGGGLGMGLVGGLIGGALFGGRRGGLFGGGDCEGGGGAETRIEDTVFNTAVLAKLGTIEGAIPLASAQTENVILQQTNAIGSALASLALGTQQAFGNTKDTVQNVGALNLAATNNVNQNVLTEGCKTRESVAAAATAILSRIDRFEIDDLRHRAERNERAVEIQSLRSNIEINNTNTATATAAQQQFQLQAQLQDVNNQLRRCFDMVNVVHQEAKATNNNVIAGNTGAVVTGPQTANPTNVRA
jgi:hypothetical protein